MLRKNISFVNYATPLDSTQPAKPHMAINTSQYIFIVSNVYIII